MNYLRNHLSYFEPSASLGTCHLSGLDCICVGNHPEPLGKCFELGDAGESESTHLSFQCSGIRDWLFSVHGCSGSCQWISLYFFLSCDLTLALGGYIVLCPASSSAVRSPLTTQACLQVTDNYAYEDPGTASLFLMWWKEMARWAYLIILCTWKRLLAVAPPGCLSDMLI